MDVAECAYKEWDRELKEQFIHGLNEKIMLDEIIRELTSRTSNVQMTSRDVLAWAKRVEAQRAQAAVLNDLTEIRVFDKIKRRLIQRVPGEDKHRLQHTKDGHADTAGKAMHCTKTMPSLWEKVCSMRQDRALQEGVQEQKKPCSP